jgi:hypothetical protein
MPFTHHWLICAPILLLKWFHLPRRTTLTLPFPVFQGKFQLTSSRKSLRSLGPDLFPSPPPIGPWPRFSIWGQELTPDSYFRSRRCISGDCPRSWGWYVQTCPDGFCPLRSDAATWPGQRRIGSRSWPLSLSPTPTTRIECPEPASWYLLVLCPRYLTLSIIRLGREWKLLL